MAITLNGSTGIDTPTIDGTAEHVTSVTGFKNRIINGVMLIDQRNAGASKSVTGAIYTLDRFAVQASSLMTIQQINSTITGFAKSLKLTATATNTYQEFGQQIEYLNFADLAGQIVTLSFWAKANNTNAASTNLQTYFRYSTTQDATVIFIGTVSGSPTTTITTTSAFYTVQTTIPATAKAFSLEINCNGTAVSGDGFEITGVQLEKGSTATSFDVRPYGTELALCQRYLPVAGQGDAYYGYSYATTATIVGYQFKVTPRIAPTGMTTSALSNFTLTSGVAGTGNPTVITLGLAGTNSCEIAITSTVGSPTLIAGQGARLSLGASGQILFTGCEL